MKNKILNYQEKLKKKSESDFDASIRQNNNTLMQRILRLTIEENVFNYKEVVDEVNTIIIAVS